MSYCVNCGVELENGCGACPLCDTPIINPRESGGKSQKPPYPENFNIPESADKRYFVFVVSIAMLIPNIVLSVLDFAFFHTGAVTYIASASALIWIWFLFPLLWKKPLPLLLLTLDAASLAAFLNLIRIKSESAGWFSAVALPIVVSLWLVSALFMLWLKKPRSRSLKAIAALTAINIVSFVVEICFNMFYNNKLQIWISLAVTACCIPLTVFFVALSKSRRLKAWVSRKFYV